MTEAENLVGQPGVNGATQLVEFAGEEMIDAFDDHEMIVTGKRGDERFDFFDGAVLVVASMHEQFWLFFWQRNEKSVSLTGIPKPIR